MLTHAVFRVSGERTQLAAFDARLKLYGPVIFSSGLEVVPDSNPNSFLRRQAAMVANSGLDGDCPVLFEPMLSTDGNVAHLGVQYAEPSEIGELAAIGNGDAD